MSIKTTGVRYDLIAKDSASRVFETVGKSAGRLEGGLGKLLKASAMASAALAGGLAAGLAVSAEKAVAFQSEMTKIQTQAGATAKDVKVLSAQVLELGKTTQQGPQALAESMYHLKSVGMDNVAAMKALKVASDLAAVGGANLESTTNALAGAWRSGIRGAESFGKTAASVNAIIGAGNMRMEDFTAAIGTGILPSAKSFGLSLNQVGAALALMTDEGIPAVDAATRLRMSFSLLGAPSGKADKELKTIGLSGTKLATAMRGPDGLIGAMSLLKSHLDASGLSAVQQSQVISHAFGGGRSSSGILTLLNNLEVLKKKQDQVNASMGKFPAAVEAQRKTAEAQLKILESNLNVMAIQVGTKTLPVITSFVTFLSQKALPAIWGFGHDLAHRFIPVDEIKTGFSAVSGMVSDFISGLQTAPAKRPVLTVPTPTVKAPTTWIPDWLRKPYQFTVPSPTIGVPTARIPDWLKAVMPKAPVKSEAKKLGEQVRALISGGIGDAVGKIDWSKLGKTIGTGLGTAFSWVTSHGADLSKKVAKALGGIDFVQVGKTFAVVALPLAIGFVDNVFAPLFTVDFWKKHWLDTILAAISFLPVGKFFGKISDLFAKIPWGKLGDLLSHVPWGKIFGWAKWIGDTLGSATTAAGDFVSRLATGFGRAFTRYLPKVAQWFSTELGLIPTRIGLLWLDIEKAFGKLISKVPGMGSKFTRSLLKIAGRFTMYQTGIHIVEGLLSGIWDKMKDIGKWAETNIVDPLVSWVESLFGIHSPSTVFASIGGYLVDGLLGGIWSGMQGIGKWLDSHVISPVTDKFSGAGNWLYGHGSDVISGLKSGAWSVAKGVGGWVWTHVITPVTSPFADAWTWLSSSGRSLVDGLKNGIVSGLKDVGSWIKSNLVDPVVNSVKHWFGIKSPSTVFATLGGHLVSGLIKGLASSSGLDIAKRIFGDLPSALAGIVGKGLAHIEQLPGKALSALRGLGGKAANLLGSAANSVGNFLAGGNPSASMSSSMQVGQQMLAARGFQAREWPALRQLWTNESGWRVDATNPSSGAYGIPQALPASKMASAGADWRTNAATQIAWGLDYIKQRYGTPSFALAAWQSRSPHWYAKGGLAQFGETAWVGEKGAELMQVTSKGTRIYNHADSLALARGAGIKLPGYAGGTVDLGAARRGVTDTERQVTRLEQQIAALRRAEAMTRSRSRRKRDQLAIMAAEERLKAARTEVTAAKHRLTTAQAQAKQVTNVANALQNGFLKSLETGTAAGIASAVKSINTKLQAAGAGYLVPGNLQTAGRLESLANQRSSIQSRIAAAGQYATTQSGNIDSFLSLSNIPSGSIAALLQRMQAKQKVASGFAAEVADLSKRGLDKGLLSQLATDGPGSQLAALLSKASASDIAKLNKLAVSQQKLTVSFGQSMANSMYDSGAQAGKGFLSGLQGQEKAIQAEMNRLADGMVATIKHRLGIRSPSTVMRDQIGKQAALGVALGVRMHAPMATAEAQRMADTMAAVRARSGMVMAGAGAGGGSGQHAIHTEHHTHYEINARTADFTTQELEVVQRRAEARQRVGRPR